jgi:hypothetical protein
MEIPVNSREVPGKQKEDTIMRRYERFSVSLVLWLFFAAFGSHTVGAQTPQKTMNNPQGGNIVYGVVGGATSEADAMSKMLRVVHNNCGERPQVGKVFKVRGTNSVAVFFSEVNRSQGNKQMAGMIIAVASGPNRIEAAMVSDDAARFGSSINPLLNKLFSQWHPGGAGQAPGSAPGGGSAPAAPLHQVVASDNSASVGIPNGWTLKGSMGTMIVNGPNSEVVGLDFARQAVDPRGAGQRQAQYYGRPANNTGKIVYPSNVDPVRAFPDLFQQFWRVNGGNPNLRIAHAEQVQGPPGQRCAHATGHATLGGNGGAEKDMPEMEALLCSSAAGPMGNYTVLLSMSLIPPNLADRERATVGAILASFQPNQAVISQQANAMAAPAIAQIHAIGNAAMQRAQADSVAHDQQNRTWEAGQDSQAKRNQAFSNYLLDQTVIQDNNMYGNGTIGHGTVWNSEADALVKANPNRYEIVDTPNFWKGVDY